MDIGSRILSGIQVHDKYGRYSYRDSRRETWGEIVDRNRQMHVDFYGSRLTGNARLMGFFDKAYEHVLNMQVMPSMRSLQFAGKPILLGHNRMYNCSYMPIDNLASFSEAMFLLLGGSGVGYSVQARHVSQLPKIQKAQSYRRYIIADSKEGWADAVKMLIKAYFGASKTIPRFDYSEIRSKGTPLKTSGGNAPGPKPLRDCLSAVESVLMEKRDGDRLTPLEAHDIMCHIANSVLAGGIRRSAMICLFDRNDEDMLRCKAGQWWETNPQRGRANNSAILPRGEVSKEEFTYIFSILRDSGFGEPGFFWTNDLDWGLNPCGEIALRPNQFCNLTNVTVTDVGSTKDLIDRAASASLLGTLQAGYTDFHYLRPIWQKTTEKDALLGVGLIGIASTDIRKLDLAAAAQQVFLTNDKVSDILGINPAARMTCVKPDGNSSVLLGTSPGIHAWHSPYFIRTARISKGTAMYERLIEEIPSLVEDDLEKADTQAVVSIPVKAPDGAITKDDESAIDLLTRVKDVKRRWIDPGHMSGENTHNVSVTVNVKDDEWGDVEDWMWKNKRYYNCISILPHFDHKYRQAPYQKIDEARYQELVSVCKEIDFSSITENEDKTTRQNELACAGGACEI